METFEATGPVRAEVETPYGEVDVATHDAPRAEVDVQALRDDEATREAVAETKVELVNGVLRVAVPKRAGWFLTREPKIRIEVRVPAGSSLAFRTASAGVTTHGALAEVRGKTASGDIRVETAERLHVDAASGGVSADAVTGDADVRTASGDVRLGRVGGRLTVSSVSGDVRTGSVGGGASANTVSGTVDVASVAGGDVTIRSVSGDVTLGVAPDTAVHVDVTTVSGDLSSDVDLGDTPGAGGGPVIDIRGRTVSGDVRIRRAVA